ncbi:huntingtin-interacting protein 1 isoform X2 [Octopus sinensis]|uniref:Huntingtin-interacting protein 1 isoform X2 n=1 Tax=Octopus sinensis TaxID=2607531 RepID=A0A7E6FSZ4_9MOLL|nr:huntingtin-interacting protein 1 isoform X2 [Octopus sinensis]
MSSLHLPRVISQRGKTAVEVERENFEKAQSIAINKAINSNVHPVKEKHVRSAILGTFHESGAGVFWATTSKLPLQGNAIICWKFLHVLHKLLREGHANVILDSQKYISLLKDIGKLWGHLKDGYGRLIAAYTKLLIQKLSFHKKNPRIPGSLTMTDEQFNKIFGADVNNYFEVSCDMLDYLDEILVLQEAVFGSLDMSRSNSMTNSGQCRLAPLIPCILDSCQLYDYLVKSLFKLHSSLPPDTLSGHRDRFLAGYRHLKQFYHQSGTLQYFKNLVQVPLLPDDPPNFTIASDFSKHVKPVAVVPEEMEPEAETPEFDGIGFLIDTSSPIQETDKFDETFGEGSMDSFNFNGQPQIDERDMIIEQLHKEIQQLREEIERLQTEAQMKIQPLLEEKEQLKKILTELQLTLDNTLKENELIKKELEEMKTVLPVADKLNDSEKLVKANEEKFKKMKDIYGKLREEHVTLLRVHAEVSKQLKDEKKLTEEKDMLLKKTTSELDSVREEQKQLEVATQAKTDQVSLQLQSSTQQCSQLEKSCQAATAAAAAAASQRNHPSSTTAAASSPPLPPLPSPPPPPPAQHTNDDYEELTKEIELIKAQKLQLETDLNDVRSSSLALEESLQVTKTEKEETAEKLQKQVNCLQNELEEKTKEMVVAKETLQKEMEGVQSQLKSSQSTQQTAEENYTKNKEEMERKYEDLLTEKKTSDNEREEALKKLYQLLIESCVKQCNSILLDATEQSDNLLHLTVGCSADYLLDRILPVYECLEKLGNSFQNYKSNPISIQDLITSMVDFSHRLSDSVQYGLATSHSAQLSAGEELNTTCKNTIDESMKALTQIEKDENSVLAQFGVVLENVKKMQSCAETLLPKIADVKDKEIGDMVESEMQLTTSAIDLAASKIEEMLKKTQEDTTGLNLEVNESILDACTGLMQAIKVLVEKSRDLQKEIVAQGRGASSAKEFYNKHHRWTEGLLSAAKAVGWGATATMEAADKVVQGEGKFEELIVYSKEIAASTIQLVVASKVKADRNSKHLKELTDASKKVNQAAGKVIGSAKTGANAIEERSLMDFSSLNLHQTKKQEMQIKVLILEMEKDLKNEYEKLSNIRKHHYQLAGESEGWDVEEDNKS